MRNAEFTLSRRRCPEPHRRGDDSSARGGAALTIRRLARRSATHREQQALVAGEEAGCLGDPHRRGT